MNLKQHFVTVREIAVGAETVLDEFLVLNWREYGDGNDDDDDNDDDDE